MGYLAGSLHAVERAALAVGAALLFFPGLTPSLVGLGLCGTVAVRRVALARSPRAVADEGTSRGPQGAL